jgi:hypothetical protein
LLGASAEELYILPHWNALPIPAGHLIAKDCPARKNSQSIIVMKPELDTATFPLSEDPSVPDSEMGSTTIGSRFLNWLAHFVLYLGAVSVVCATGFYFFLQIPILRDPSIVLESQGSPSYKPLASIMKPPEQPAKPRADNNFQPLANPSGDSISENPSPTSSATTASASLETDSDPNAPPQVIEQPDDSPNGQTELADAASEEPPPEEPTPATPQAEIEQLLADARQQMDSRRITAPASSNALSTYQRILELEPGHPAALEGIENIAAYYRDVAEQSLRRGRPDESLAYISRGLRATPQNSNLLNLRQQARLVQQQREQAQREEMRRQQIEQEIAEQRYQEQLRQQRAQQSQAPWWQQTPSYNNSTGGFNQR